MENNYGVALMEFCEEFDSYVFFISGGYSSKAEAQKVIEKSPHGGYLVKRVPCTFHGIKTFKMVKV